MTKKELQLLMMICDLPLSVPVRVFEPFTVSVLLLVFTRLAALKKPEKVVLVVWLNDICREALCTDLALET